MSGTGKWDYMRVTYERYQKAKDRKAKGKLLDEYCEVTKCHRKNAIRVLNNPPPPKVRPKRRRKLTYGADVISVVEGVWEASGYLWSKRLKAALPVWMPSIREHYGLSKETEQSLLAISPAQMDRRLRGKKQKLKKRIYGTTKPGSLLKHQIPIQTQAWDMKVPGYMEVDLVSHSGSCADGEFAHTLDMGDGHTTWVERRAVLGKGAEGVRDAIKEVEGELPFALKGIDSDNGSEFINAHLLAYCNGRNIKFTRGRPYKKDDNAHIEQKNWTHVRKLLGYGRLDTPAAVAAMNDLYRHELRWFQNFFQPSVKLVKKVRKGSKLKKVYDEPKTPLERVMMCQGADKAKVAVLKALRDRLDPFELSKVVDEKLAAIVAMATKGPVISHSAPATYREVASHVPMGYDPWHDLWSDPASKLESLLERARHSSRQPGLSLHQASVEML